MGVPQLVFLTPKGFLQRIRQQDQHLAGVVLLGAVTETMLGAKQSQLLIRLPIESHEAIQYGRMTSNGDIGNVPFILRNVVPCRPLLVRRVKTAIPLEFLQGCGQHPFGAFVAVLLQHRGQTRRVQVHSVEVSADSILNGFTAGNIGFMALSPQRKLISAFGLLCRPTVQVSFIHLCHHLDPLDTGVVTCRRRYRSPLAHLPAQTGNSRTDAGRTESQAGHRRGHTHNLSRKW